MLWRTTLAVCLALSSFGCAYGNALDRGHRLATAGDYRGAWEAYQRASRIDPDEHDARRFAEQVRPYAARQSLDYARHALTREAFDEALAHANYLQRLDPAAADAMRAEVLALRERLANAFVVRARAHESAGQQADAALCFARAWEIARRDDDLRHMRRHTRELRRKGAFVLSLSADGDRRRASRLESELAARARTIEGVAFAVGEEDVTAAAHVAAAAPQCEQQADQEQAWHAYAAGVDWVPNPRYRELEAEEQRLAATLAALEHDAEEHARAHELAEQIEAETAAHGTASQLHAVRHELAGEPEHVSQPRIEQYPYVRQLWTRSCIAEGELELTLAWREGDRRAFRQERQTFDATHAASPAHGLDADGLAFPESDAALIAAADALAAAHLERELRALVSAYYRFLAERALAWQPERPDDAAEIMIASYVAAKGQLDAEAIDHYRAHLHRRAGLQDLDVLRR